MTNFDMMGIIQEQGGELLDELHIGQPTLSHHMKILCDAGIVRGRKEGKWTHYSFDPQGVQKAKELLDEITEFSPGCSDNCSCKQ